MFFHSEEIVVKPPCGAVRDLAGYAAVVICAAERVDHSIVYRIERVDDHLGKQAFAVKFIHEARQRSYEVKRACDDVTAAVDSGFIKHY